MSKWITHSFFMCFIRGYSCYCTIFIVLNVALKASNMNAAPSIESALTLMGFISLFFIYIPCEDIVQSSTNWGTLHLRYCPTLSTQSLIHYWTGSLGCLFTWYLEWLVRAFVEFWHHIATPAQSSSMSYDMMQRMSHCSSKSRWLVLPELVKIFKFKWLCERFQWLNIFFWPYCIYVCST